MSKAEMIRFVELLKGDEMARNEVKGMGADFEAIAAYATGRGFELSASDFSIDEELSEEDLDGVAGGNAVAHSVGDPSGGFFVF